MSISAAFGSWCRRRYSRVRRTRSSSNGMGRSTIFGSSAVLVAALAVSACAHTRPATTTIWLGGDVHLGTGGRGALAGIAAIVRGATGVVNLEGPVGDGSSSEGGGDDPPRLTQAPSALVELR